MEFLQHKEFIESLRTGGMVERVSGGLARYEIVAEHAGLSPRVVIFGAGGADADPAGSRRVEAPAASLPKLIEGIIHKEHLAEVALCPAGAWGPIVDLLAFELAADEHWNEIDAEIALNLRTRNPLILDGPDLRLCRKIAGTILEQGEPGAHDFAVVALGAPVAINVEQRGRLVVWCGNPAIADVVASLRPA